MESRKEVMFSGIQPSNEPHLGNYLGAVKDRGARADEFDCSYFMADMHTITTRQTPAELRRRTLEQVAQYIVCGLDPEHNTILIQSHVHQHTELVWVLECYTIFGELSHMTQFKGRSTEHADNINTGLSTYLCLMAADILFYQPDFVPVGEDQKQHMELTHSVAQRFNHVYSDALKVPKPHIPKMGARVMSLNQPDAKMNRSIPEGCVFLMDKPKGILYRSERAITDSDTERYIRLDWENKPGVSNLMSIYSVVTGRSFKAIETELDSKGCDAFKSVVDEAMVEVLWPIQGEIRRLLSDKAYLESVYRAGAEKVSCVAEKTLCKVRKEAGFLAW